MTEQSLLKAKIDLYNISSNHAMESYIQANYSNTGKRKSKKHIPYSLNTDVKKAMEVYHMVCGKKYEDITLEQEEQVKGYLLIYRTSRTEYLKEGYKGGSWYYQDKIDKLGIEI